MLWVVLSLEDPDDISEIIDPQVIHQGFDPISDKGGHPVFTSRYGVNRTQLFQ